MLPLLQELASTRGSTGTFTLTRTTHGWLQAWCSLLTLGAGHTLHLHPTTTVPLTDVDHHLQPRSKP